MKKTYVKSEKGYGKTSEFEEKKIVDAMRRLKSGSKVPTSVALDPKLVAEIKVEAESRGLPYQVLLRMFIIDGFKKWRKAG
ncbi:MAG TPA: hypothetical protein VJL87_07015 [Bdellovibrionota bacterium]|nr:hypothetical protein [Bdellovibrionota bacterium]